ncbi:MAG: 16S rRNA processing protein RimM, partial [Halobacteriovoraceae bacterium]|nr:16S rRNA processing protein RimM [Halobacteriovoraceae bacterium]
KSNISDELETYEIEKIKGKDKSLIKLKELDSPEKSRGLVNKDTYLKRSSFRQLNESEFYLADLIGVEVFDFHDQALGCVEKYYNNGGHEVCCLNTNLEFPLIKKFIKEINLKEKVMSLTLTKEFFDELS